MNNEWSKWNLDQKQKQKTSVIVRQRIYFFLQLLERHPNWGTVQALLNILVYPPLNWITFTCWSTNYTSILANFSSLLGNLSNN